MFGWIAPVPVDVEVSVHAGRVQLAIGGIAVKIPAEIAFQLSNQLVDAAEAAQNKGKGK